MQLIDPQLYMILYVFIITVNCLLFSTFKQTRILQSVLLNSSTTNYTVSANFQPLQSNSPSFFIYLRYIQFRLLTNVYFKTTYLSCTSSSFRVRVQHNSNSFYYRVYAFINARNQILEIVTNTINNPNFGVSQTLSFTIQFLSKWSSNILIFSNLNGFTTAASGTNLTVGVYITSVTSSGFSFNILNKQNHYSLSQLQMAYLIVDPDRLYPNIENAQLITMNNTRPQSQGSQYLYTRSNLLMLNNNQNMLMGVQFYFINIRFSYIANNQDNYNIMYGIISDGYCITNYLVLIYTACAGQDITFVNLNDITCVNHCPDSYFQNTFFRICELCMKFCLSCTNRYSCWICNPTFQLIIQCACPQRFILSQSSLFCQSCGYNCRQCISTKLCINCLCTNCFLLSGACKINCLQNCLQCLEQDKCLICQPNYELLDINCYKLVSDYKLQLKPTGFVLKSDFSLENINFTYALTDCRADSNFTINGNLILFNFKANKYLCKISYRLEILYLHEQKVKLTQFYNYSLFRTQELGVIVRVRCKQNLTKMNCSFFPGIISQIQVLLLNGKAIDFSAILQKKMILGFTFEIISFGTQNLTIMFKDSNNTTFIRNNVIELIISPVKLSEVQVSILSTTQGNIKSLSLVYSILLMSASLIGMLDSIDLIFKSIMIDLILSKIEGSLIPDNFILVLNLLNSISSISSIPFVNEFIYRYTEFNTNLSIICFFLSNVLILSSLKKLLKLIHFILAKIFTYFKKHKSKVKVVGFDIFSLSFQFQFSLIHLVFDLTLRHYRLIFVYIIFFWIAFKNLYFYTHQVPLVKFIVHVLQALTILLIVLFKNYVVAFFSLAIIQIIELKQNQQSKLLKKVVDYSCCLKMVIYLILIFLRSDEARRVIGWLLATFTLTIILSGTIQTLKQQIATIVTLLKRLRTTPKKIKRYYGVNRALQLRLK